VTVAAASARRQDKALCDDAASDRAGPSQNDTKNAAVVAYSADADVAETWTPLPPKKYRLQMSVVVHRHGDRTPISKSKGEQQHTHSRHSHASDNLQLEESRRWSMSPPVRLVLLL
jgi:hypothetical protein